MSLAASYFEQLYANDADPWSLASRWYEQRKYALTLAALPRARYRRGFEPGCSVGVLTELLASRCDRLLSTDVASEAVHTTRSRVGSNPAIEVRRLEVPQEWPAGSFDLIVISELGYYLAPPDLAVLVNRAASALAPDGDLVVVHWRHHVPDYPLSGDDVRRAFRDDPRLGCVAAHVEDDFVLDVLEPLGAPSVAAREGLVS